MAPSTFRRIRRGALAAAIAALAVGCGVDAGGGDGGDDGGARARITSDDGARTVTVEVADTAAERRRGLMGRTSLPRDHGMAFLYDEDTDGGFWMKDTLIPLSIAFFDGEGRIVRILDMEPCRRDPCPVYRPGAGYRGALEVRRGSFARWGVAAGDTITIE
jgi:uncharacterized membrane protein (UPF0127 family)